MSSADPRPGSDRSVEPERAPQNRWACYERLEQLGKGGMATVFRARERATGREVALKLVDSRSSEAAARFRLEATALARLTHPHIVSIHELLHDPPGIVMELVEGEPLSALLARPERRPDRRSLVTILARVARAVHHAHANGIVHRDLKPDNVIVMPDGQPKVADFGIALLEDEGARERLTRTGTLLGTPLYMSPEQATGRIRDVDPRTDVHALGVMLYEVLTGRTPFTGTPLAVLVRIAAEPPPAPRTLARGVPPALEAVALRALAKDPSARQASAAELADALEAWLDGREIAGARRRPGRLALAVGAVALALVSVGLERRREAAAGTLRQAQEALERGEKAFARWGELTAVAPVSSAADTALAEALASLDVAGERARTSLGAGSSAARATIAAVESVRSAVAVAGAANDLVAGRAEAALTRVQSLSTPDARLVRARALAALGRRDEARREALEWTRTGGVESPRLREGAADVLAATGEPARARELYTELLPAAGRRKREVQAKRGGAAALAGDEREALSDLRSLVPDPLALAEDRAANAALAPLAPVLYRRGLGVSDGPTRERDLEGAWRLAAPPAELAPALAAAWSRPAVWDRLNPMRSAHEGVGGEDLRVCRREVALLRRAVALDPLVDFDRRWTSFGELVLSAENHGSRTGVADDLRAQWPDGPELLFLAATGSSLAGRRGAEQRAYAAIDGLLALPRHDHDALRRMARRCVDLVVFEPKTAEEPPDWARLRRVAEIADSRICWLHICALANRAVRNDLARELLDRAAAAGTADETGTEDGALLTEIERCGLLQNEGRLDEAIACARAADRARPSPDSLELVIASLRVGGRWQEVVDAAAGREPLKASVLDALVAAYDQLHLGPEAAAARARLRQLRDRGAESPGASGVPSTAPTPDRVR